VVSRPNWPYGVTARAPNLVVARRMPLTRRFQLWVPTTVFQDASEQTNLPLLRVAAKRITRPLLRTQSHLWRLRNRCLSTRWMAKSTLLSRGALALPIRARKRDALIDLPGRPKDTGCTLAPAKPGVSKTRAIAQLLERPSKA
jgi:hypothetical protein